MPSLMLSGFIFEISSMPAWIQYICNIIPAKYFITCLQQPFPGRERSGAADSEYGLHGSGRRAAAGADFSPDPAQFGVTAMWNRIKNLDRQRAADPAARPENPDHHHRVADHAAGRLFFRFDAGGQEHLDGRRGSWCGALNSPPPSSS